MAKVEFSAVDDVAEQMGQIADGLRRTVIREVVQAGAEKYAEMLKQEIRARHHIASGSMEQNVKAGKYYETVGGGFTYVYPHGADNRGIDNARKAFIINYGRGGRRTEKTGDRFITNLERTAEDPVQNAMAQKWDECMKQYTK